MHGYNVNLPVENGGLGPVVGCHSLGVFPNSSKDSTATPKE